MSDQQVPGLGKPGMPSRGERKLINVRCTPEDRAYIRLRARELGDVDEAAIIYRGWLLDEGRDEPAWLAKEFAKGAARLDDMAASQPLPLDPIEGAADAAPDLDLAPRGGGLPKLSVRVTVDDREYIEEQRALAGGVSASKYVYRGWLRSERRDEPEWLVRDFEKRAAKLREDGPASTNQELPWAWGEGASMRRSA